MTYPKHLQKVINSFKRLPGVGSRTAERYAFQMLSWTSRQREEFNNIISEIEHHIVECPMCGCLCDREACFYCSESRQSSGVICVVAQAKDVCTLEDMGAYEGMYHVLGGLLSPLQGKGTKELRLEELFLRASQNHIKEIILALDATLEGDATALYLKEKLSKYPAKVSRLAFGLPMGSAFNFIDPSTLTRAFLGRSSF